MPESQFTHVDPWLNKHGRAVSVPGMTAAPAAVSHSMNHGPESLEQALGLTRLKGRAFDFYRIRPQVII